MNFLILSFIYCVTATSIGTTKNEKVMGGSDAYLGQFPYQALIRHTNPTLYTVCGGSIISNEWILTTARCLKVRNPNEMRVIVGTIYFNSAGSIHTIWDTRQHPNFNEYDLKNDIGLIRVNEPISFNDFVKPIKLSSDSTSLGLSFIVAGWGATSIPDKRILSPTGVLKYATLKPISFDECQNSFQWILSDIHMCTSGTTGQSICPFDNGNPLVYNGLQYAMVTLPFCGQNHHPDLHTWVATYRSWIKEISGV